MATNSDGGDEPLWTPRAAGGGTGVYHTDRDCPRLSPARDPKRRDWAYIEWHDLEPCHYCAD